MNIEFPYLKRGAVYYPVVQVLLGAGSRIIPLTALVDSGASFSVFRPETAKALGIGIERGTKIYLEGIGGRILGYLHRVPMEVGSKQFSCKVVFSYEFKVSFNLIGRDNFFQYFRITLDESNRKTVLEF